MGIFKGLKDRMKAVDNLTKSINDGDGSINLSPKKEDNNGVNKEKKGIMKGFKDRMNAVDNLTKSINDSKKDD